jgi:hypothetical protein
MRDEDVEEGDSVDQVWFASAALPYRWKVGDRDMGEQQDARMIRNIALQVAASYVEQ